MEVTFGLLDRYFKVIENETYRVAKELLKQIADNFLVELQNTIYFQEIAWEPLSPKYKEWKKKNELDERILIATGEFVESFYVAESETDSPKILTLSIQLPDKAHDFTGINLQLLSRIIEYGSIKRKIPPRPYWRNIINKYIAKDDVFSSQIIRQTVDEIKKKLEKVPR